MRQEGGNMYALAQGAVPSYHNPSTEVLLKYQSTGILRVLVRRYDLTSVSKLIEAFPFILVPLEIQLFLRHRQGHATLRGRLIFWSLDFVFNHVSRRRRVQH